MAEGQHRLRYALVDGEPIVAGDLRVIPQSRVLEIRWSGGGVVWNRPVAVAVERNGQTWRMPIVDATRVAQLALGAITAFLTLIAGARVAHGMRRRHE